jgi:D-amino-acid dehydrogenase
MKIAVLGAGVVGVTSAWCLSRAGHEVVLIERREGPGLETSFANGGQISAGHAEPWAKPSVIPKLLDWLGREDAPMLFRPRASWAQWGWGLRFLRECAPGRFERNARNLAALALYSRGRLKALRAETGIEYDSLSRGILQFFTDQKDFDSAVAHADAARAYGVLRETKSAAQCLAIEPALAGASVRIAGGIYAPEDESGDAYQFTRRLAELCVERGVTMRTGTEVEGIEATSAQVDALWLRQGELPAARYSADAYVVSLGAWSPLLLGRIGVRIPVYPLKGYSITVALRPGDVAPTVSLSDDAAKVVYSRLGDRLRGAGTAELAGYDASINTLRCAAILSRARRLFPGLAHAGPVEYWAGLRPATPTNAPVIGRTRYRNLFLNTGHGTLGWTLACGSAQALADLVSGREPQVSYAFAD